MIVTDLVVEVRNPEYQRIGLITPEDLVGATFITRFNNVGSWQIKLPFGHYLGELLRLPGYGLVVTGPSDEVIISGPTLGAKLEQSVDNLQGDWIISGADDSILLQERLAYPTPTTDDVTLQTQAYDSRDGFAETVIKEYVEANLGASAPSSRQISNLVIEPDLGRGPVVYANARFKKLQELFYGLAQVANLGFKITQSDTDLVFSMYEPTDKSSIIRMDLENQNLSKTEYGYQSAKLTRAIVAGQGEAEQRTFIEVTNADSLEAEEDWGRRSEFFKDQRNTNDNEELTTAGLEELAENGKTIAELQVTPSDDVSMRYGIDWNLGDKVTVVVNELELVSVVTEIGISIASDGVRIGAVIGTPTTLDFESKVITVVNKQEERISNLERSTTGYGVNKPYEPTGGTVGGTQPTASAPFIEGSFNRFGNMVHFNIQVDMDTITSFGTGQYYVTLPYPTRVRYTFANGHLLDTSSAKTYNLVGECAADSDVILLYAIGSNGQMDAFTFNNPANLDTTDYFDISGTYEIEG